jgi:hypothetical protein
MKCRDFHQLLADWQRGRLTGESAERMTRHAADCRSCAEEAELERSLRVSFAAVDPIMRTPDLWERIEARVETVKQPRFAFRFPRAFALSGALAAGVLFAAIALRGPVVPINDDGPKDNVASNEPGVLEKFHTIRMTETETAGAFTDATPSGTAAHLLLVGGPGR